MRVSFIVAKDLTTGKDVAYDVRLLPGPPPSDSEGAGAAAGTGPGEARPAPAAGRRGGVPPRNTQPGRATGSELTWGQEKEQRAAAVAAKAAAAAAMAAVTGAAGAEEEGGSKKEEGAAGEAAAPEPAAEPASAAAPPEASSEEAGAAGGSKPAGAATDKPAEAPKPPAGVCPVAHGRKPSPAAAGPQQYPNFGGKGQHREAQQAQHAPRGKAEKKEEQHLPGEKRGRGAPAGGRAGAPGGRGRRAGGRPPGISGASLAAWLIAPEGCCSLRSTRDYAGSPHALHGLSQ